MQTKIDWKKKLDPGNLNRLQCPNLAALDNTFQQKSPTFLSQKPNHQQNATTKKHVLQNSVILEKRYKTNEPTKESLLNNNNYDSYTSIISRKNENIPIVAKEKKNSKKFSYLNAALRKLDNGLKKITSKESGTELNNETCSLIQDNLSPPYHVTDSSTQFIHNRPLELNKSGLRRVRDVGKQTEVIETKDLSKEKLIIVSHNNNHLRLKTKYSPPPEVNEPNNCIIQCGVASSKLKSAEFASCNSNSSQLSQIDQSVAVSKMIRGGLKWKERVVVGLCVAVVLFTLLVLVDVQMDLGFATRPALVASHGRVKFDMPEERPESVYNRFKKRLLQKNQRLV